jgi:hypothetical protein
MDRITRLLGTATRSQCLLELGAGYNPVAPKSGGWKTHVVDHATRGELQKKYATGGVDTDLIEDVDTIWRGGSLHEAVPADLLNHVDLIIASHVLEHIPDLIGFFQSASQLVRFGGLLSVALPDRRYCFDCFRPWTTTGGLLEAHHQDMNRHSLRTAFDHVAYSATVDGQLAWAPRPVGEPVLMDPFAAAESTVNLFGGHSCGPYQDYHAWQFTPAGFRLIMLELLALGVCDWQVAALHGPENFEFFAVLRRSGTQQLDPATLQTQRQSLLLAQLAETREQINFIMGGAEAAPGHEREMYDELIAKLTEQDRRLREMSETLTWLRAVLSPVRRVWRTLRGRRPDGG